MSRKMKCFNWKGYQCCILKVFECPANCKAGIYTPEKYIEMLEEMLAYNEKNNNTCGVLRKEIRTLREQYGIYYEINTKDINKSLVGLSRAYYEDTHRGERGGNSEGNSNPAGMKQKMKDNRPVVCKMNKQQREEIKEATQEFESQHGKLEKLSRSPLSRNKKDSYTGDDIK